MHGINLHICFFTISNEFEDCSNFISSILHTLRIMHRYCKRRRDLWPPLHLTQRGGHVQLELVADWRVTCGGGPSGPAATVRRCRCGLCREEGHKGNNCASILEGLRSLHNYLVKTYSVNHPGVTTRFGGRKIGLLD